MKPLTIPFILLLVFLPLPTLGGQKIASIEIEIVSGGRSPSGANGHPSVKPDERLGERAVSLPAEINQIRNVLPIREGDPFDPARVEQALSTLRKWGRFSVVDVRERQAADGVHLRFLVHEGYLVSGIDIYGGYPYLSRRLRRMITVHSGDLYVAEQAQEQEEKLETFFERRGYADTEVTFTPRLNDTKRTVDLVYRIQRGSRYRFGEITVVGNTVFPYSYFVSQINPLFAYEPSRFRKNLEKIRKDYQGKGYLRARVRLKDLGKDAASRKVNPVIEISEGKHAVVVFEGNNRVSRKTFKKILPMYTERGYGRYEIDASVEAMRDHYHRLGFQEVAIQVDEKELSENELFIRFIIDEGPQTRVKKIAVEGNEEISDRRIKKNLITKENGLFQRGTYQPRTVEQDFKDLPRILKSQGALEGEAVDYGTTFNRFHDKAHVTFVVEEGEITRLKKIEFTGNPSLSSRRLKRSLLLEEGDPFNPEKLERDEKEIVLVYANHGHPYAEVTSELLRDGPEATLIFHVEEGTEVRIGEILIVGNERTIPKAVKRALTIRKDQPFSYRKILESERSLRRTTSFRNVKIETIGLTEKESTVHLLVKLEEYRKILLDFGVTYDTDDSFTGNLTISHLNLFGTTKSGILKLTGGRDIQGGEAILRDPHFLGYNFELSLSGLVEREARPAFKTLEGGGALTFLREFTPQLTFLGRYEVRRTVFRDVVDPTDVSQEDHTTSKFSLSLHYDKRDSFADPQKGYVAFGGVDFSNKLFASTFNFVQPKGYFAHYLKLGGRTVLMNFFRMEGIKVFGSDILSRNERLFLGGDYSIRGFDEDGVGPVGADGLPAGGQLLLAWTTEVQVRLFNNFKLGFFLDSGSLTDNFSEISTASLRHSAGVGLRYVTPVGPIRLDYGFKLDKAAGESVGRLHFAFGYAF